MQETGAFRHDLYCRLSEITIEIPPLRQRTGDAVMLAKAFLRRHADTNNPHVRGFSEKAVAAIDRYEWPGNVRELENRIKRAVIMADSPSVDSEQFGIDGGDGDHCNLDVRDVRETAERKALVRALSQSDHNIAKAAALLGVSRPILYNLMKKQGLK